MMMSCPAYKSQCGFSLVELAIALVVIGLLLAGVTKGQEVIQNARVNRVVMDVKNYEIATKSFKRDFGALPGDIPDPSRLPNCTAAPCATGGNGSSYINTAILAYIDDTRVSTEEANYWLHLAVTGLISGVDPTYPVGAARQPGITHPGTPVGGIYNVVWLRSVAPFPGVVQNAFRVVNFNTATETLPFFTAKQGGMIDRKIDDGSPATGRVIATRVGAAILCGTASAYPETAENAYCNVMFLMDK